MGLPVAIVYNQPETSRYDLAGETAAVVGVLEAVKAVHRSLLELGKEVIEVPLLPSIDQARRKLETLSVSLIFNLFEGFCGLPETEALVPVIAEVSGRRYTGCPGAALRLALDKAKTKSVLVGSGLPTPRFQVLTPASGNRFRLRFPCIVKPVAEDASHGLSEASVVRDVAALKKQIKAVSEGYGGEALVEEFIEGREFNATVLGGREPYPLPPSEIVYSLPASMPRILSFAAKWEPETVYYRGTRAVCPADIDAGTRAQIVKIARTAFKLIGCRGYARVDMRLDSEGKLNVLEVNPNPDISPDTGAARQASAAGLTYNQFIEKIVLLALEGH